MLFYLILKVVKRAERLETQAGPAGRGVGRPGPPSRKEMD
jgi:hypothetical protein